MVRQATIVLVLLLVLSVVKGAPVSQASSLRPSVRHSKSELDLYYYHELLEQDEEENVGTNSADSARTLFPTPTPEAETPVSALTVQDSRPTRSRSSTSSPRPIPRVFTGARDSARLPSL